MTEEAKAKTVKRTSELASAAMVEGVQNVSYWGRFIGEKSEYIEKLKQPEDFERLGLKVATGIEKMVNHLILQAQKELVDIYIDDSEDYCDTLEVTVKETMGESAQVTQCWVVTVTADVKFKLITKDGKQADFCMHLGCRRPTHQNYMVHLVSGMPSHGAGMSSAFDYAKISLCGDGSAEGRTHVVNLMTDGLVNPYGIYSALKHCKETGD